MALSEWVNMTGKGSKGAAKRIGMALLGILLGSFFLWLAFRNVHIDEIGRVFRSIQFEWVAIACSMYASSLLLRIVRWWSLLCESHPVAIRIKRPGATSR